MTEENPEHDSFIARKRPAMEGIIEHLIGPTSVLDNHLGGKPLFPDDENGEFEPEVELIPEKPD